MDGLNEAQTQEPFAVEAETERPEEKITSRRDLVEHFIELSREKRACDAKLKEIKGQMDQLEPIITDYFAEEGWQNLKTKGGHTVYLSQEIFASLVRDEKGNLDAAHGALREHGLEHLVKEGVNTQSLKAYVRELRDEKEEIPPGLVPFVKVSEVFRVRVRL